MIDWRDIKRGKTTDVYFLRTRKILGKLKKNPRVAMEISAERLPEGYSWAVFTGLEDVLRLLEGKPVDVYGLPEGSVFYPGEPVLTIEGRYREFGIYET
ncbi:nicotinate phosphoribosyltransferase, partial [bacterium]